jgi:hypothetical protein
MRGSRHRSYRPFNHPSQDQVTPKQPTNQTRIYTKMKITLNTYQIADELKRDSNARWSYNGSLALAEYLEEYEDGTGEQMELDTCSIRCEFSEHSSLLEWAQEYFSNALEELGFDETAENDDDEIDAKIKEYIEDHGTLIEFDGGVIVSSF